MKRGKFLLAALSLLCCGRIFAAEEVKYEPYFYDYAVHQIEKAGAPIVSDDFIIFTAEPDYRYVGIAFDFEGYKEIHPFEILKFYDEDQNVTRKVMFYCYERKHERSEIKYRLVFDGLWACDPLNPNKVYDENTNLYFSKVDDPGSVHVVTKTGTNEETRFVYKGESGLKLHLAGNFCSWDPFIYEMKEVAKGLYELYLPLPKGTYYYNYYQGLTPLTDSTNTEKVYTPEGRICSVIRVE